MSRENGGPGRDPLRLPEVLGSASLERLPGAAGAAMKAKRPQAGAADQSDASARIMGTSVAMIERVYGTLIEGAGADIARRLGRFKADQERTGDKMATGGDR